MANAHFNDCWELLSFMAVHLEGVNGEDNLRGPVLLRAILT